MQATVNGVTQNVATGLQYRPFGDTQSWTYGNGLPRLMERDLDGRLKTIHTDNYQGLYYTFNSNDEISNFVNGRSRHHDQSFSYDALSRLTGNVSPSGNQNFAYDATGNRTQHDWLVSEPYTVDPASNRLNQSHLAFTHDGRGNRRTQSWGGSTATYAYDAFNRLRSVNRDVASTYTNPNYVNRTYPAGTTSYTVNALDQRVGKSGPLGTSRFIYGGQTQLLAEQSNGVWSSYIWLGDAPIGMVRNNTLYFIHNDHLGRPDIVTDSARNAVWYAANYAFDRQVLHDQIGDLNLGFPGQYFDAETGFWYNGFRDYDGRTGRYLQSDPIGLAGGLNTYAYVGGNPVNYVDEQGLVAFPLIFTVGGCLWGAYSGYQAVDSYLDKMREYEEQKAESEKASNNKKECPNEGETVLKGEQFQDGFKKIKYGLSEIGPTAHAKIAVGPALVMAGTKSIRGGLAGIGCTGVGGAIRARF